MATTYLYWPKALSINEEIQCFSLLLLLRLSIEHHRNKALDGEIDNLQRLCAQRDMDFQQAKGKAEELGRRVRDLEDDLGAAQRKCEDTLRG